MGGDVQQDVGVPRQPEQEGHQQGLSGVVVRTGIRDGSQRIANNHHVEHDGTTTALWVYRDMSQAMAGKSEVLVVSSTVGCSRPCIVE